MAADFDDVRPSVAAKVKAHWIVMSYKLRAEKKNPLSSWPTTFLDSRLLPLPNHRRGEEGHREVNIDGQQEPKIGGLVQKAFIARSSRLVTDRKVLGLAPRRSGIVVDPKFANLEMELSKLSHPWPFVSAGRFHWICPKLESQEWILWDVFQIPSPWDRALTFLRKVSEDK